MFSFRPILGTFASLPTAKQNNMDRLPDELVIRILNFLEIKDLVHIQLVSSRYLALGRDDTIWKEECFTHSRSEARRRRQHQLDIQDARLAELRYALDSLPSGSVPVPQVEREGATTSQRIQRNRALVNWDPGYQDERLDFYQEYISRHAPVQIGWLDSPKADKEEVREATGVGILQTSNEQHAIAPLDDGSICIWDISARTTSHSGGGGRLLAQSTPGLLSGCSPSAKSESHAIMTETGAVECVSISPSTQKGYFGVGTLLHEVDLPTLQISSTKSYPWPITAFSQNPSPETPLTVGTNNTIHLYDPRDPTFAPSTPSSGGELIGGSVYSHATLTQPGPLSILNLKDDIWVAGRFTSLLNYDRRFFPRLKGTMFSGARIASLASVPHAFVPRNMNLVQNPEITISEFQTAKMRAGTTILAAAEYRGKGSLEIYSADSTSRSSEDYFYRNRQTASASKLLSVAPHGGKVVVSDGDGNLKWFERDGVNHIRSFNIQDSLGGGPVRVDPARGLWQSSSEAKGQEDIVQKLLPISQTSAANSSDGGGRPDIGCQDNLLLWTGDGKLGMLGFGHENPLGGDVWQDAVEEQQQMSTRERAREDAERQYAGAMRRALERNADEVRFVRGLGMGYSS